MPALVNGRNVTAPRHGFSRRREDTYAYQHFFHKIRNGTFVEIGAGDGEASLIAHHGMVTSMILLKHSSVRPASSSAEADPPIAL